MFRFVILLIIFTFETFVLSAAEPYYHKVEAKKGDGVYSLLRRYDLSEEYCNILQFYKLNKMEKDDILHAGNKYFIPVLIYQYNGQSIRSTIGNNDWDKAVSIQKYNETLLANKLRSSSYRESKLLWVPFSYIYCNSEQDLPEIAATTVAVQESKAVNNPEPLIEKSFKSDPLFGKEFAQYEEVDRSLKDKVYFIVSGHGGPDPGAMCTTCPSSLCEDEYAYDVALRLARNLKQHGANVEVIIQDPNDGIRTEKYLKCDKDEKCLGESKIPLNQKERLRQRTNAINMLSKQYSAKGLKDQAVIVIHVDSRSTEKRQDVFFYHHKKSEKGEKLANNIQLTFKEKYDRFQKSRGYHGTVSSDRNLYVIRNTIPPLVFIELANIRNPKDQQRLILDSNRQALANWIFQGLLRE